MYITNLTHFLDPDGNIAKTMPKQAREPIIMIFIYFFYSLFSAQAVFQK
jgi:hypothetical protein